MVRNKIELIQRDRTLTAEEKRRRIDEMLARRNDPGVSGSQQEQGELGVRVISALAEPL